MVWVFDLKTRRGKKLALPGIQFANDPTVMGKALYISDNRGDQVFRVEPAGGGLLVVVPDLVQSELRLVRLAR